MIRILRKVFRGILRLAEQNMAVHWFFCVLVAAILLMLLSLKVGFLPPPLSVSGSVAASNSSHHVTSEAGLEMADQPAPSYVGMSALREGTLCKNSDHSSKTALMKGPCVDTLVSQQAPLAASHVVGHPGNMVQSDHWMMRPQEGDIWL